MLRLYKNSSGKTNTSPHPHSFNDHIPHKHGFAVYLLDSRS